MGKSKSGSSKKDKKSKKGPKSKKDRAKAKLERQWGEKEVATFGGNATRGVKSRLGTNFGSSSSGRHSKNEAANSDEEWKSSTYTKVLNRTTDDNDDDDESSTDEALHDINDHQDDNQQAFSTLLQSIQNKSKLKRTQESIDYDSDDSEQYVKTVMERVMEQVKDDGDNNEIDDDDNSIVAVGITSTDPFTDRFSRQPLSDDEELRLKYFSNNVHNPIIKVDCKYLPEPFKEENFSLQISKILADKLRINEHAKADAKKNEGNYLQKISKLLFRAHYRELLKRRWQMKDSIGKNFDAHQSVLFPFLTNYADILVTNIDNKMTRESAQTAALLHISNHLLTSRGRINKHSHRIREMEKAAEDDSDESDHGNTKLTNNDDDDDSWRRDQGYTRPTVLVLVPTRKVCFEFVNAMCQLLDCSVVENIDRFNTEYGPPETLEAEERLTKEEQKRRRKLVIQQKGAEWNDLFGDDANDDDDFKIGISLMPKNSVTKMKHRSSKINDNTHEGKWAVKLFSDFYKSDIIVASPLGLKMTTTAGDSTGDGEEDDVDDNEPGNTDFLSSIEICLLMRADVMLMQNWDHVNDVLALINQQPTKVTSYTDFSRVRQYLLAGQAAHWRQLIIYSSFIDPSILSSFKRYAVSINGLARFRRKYTTENSSISSVLLPAQRQVFQRISCSSLATQNDDRIKYFTDIVLPQLIRHMRKHTMIYIPSYFDYVALRNILLKKDAIDFVSVSEYSQNSEVSRNRAHFLKGYKPLMLYTGRAHFFLRHAIKGVKHLIFFGLPEHAEFYSDHINRLKEGLQLSDDGYEEMDSDTSGASCLALFSKYESHSLERIVGTKNCAQMIRGEKATFVFSS